MSTALTIAQSGTSATAAGEVFHVFDARRVKAPELKGLDNPVSAAVGYVRNHWPTLRRLKRMAAAIEALEPSVHDLSTQNFKDAVGECRDLARLKKLDGDALLRGFALAREAAWRSLGKRPYPVQLMGAMAMHENRVVEMATGEGKTLTAALAAGVMAWSGRPVHVVTVNDYLVARDAQWNKPLFDLLGVGVGYVTHETLPQGRLDAYRRGVVYCTSKELVADFLRDQIMLGSQRSSTQTAVGMLAGGGLRSRALVPGLFRAIIDEADALLVDEAVTPLIISNAPQGDANADRYGRANELAQQLTLHRDFTVDRQVRTAELTGRGQERLRQLNSDTTDGFWAGERRTEELVTQALVARHCFLRDEHYMVQSDGKVVIVDEFTGRVMADRSWRHGLHQAIEVKEGVACTADKENLSRISFQKFFRQYPTLAGMTGTIWEAAGETWQIYRRPVVRIPTNKPNIRVQLPTQMFETADEKWDAVVARAAELHARGVPVLIGTRSVWSSEAVSDRLTKKNLAHSVLNARQDAEEANIISKAGQPGAITVATNMAGRGTDIELGHGVAALGGLHVLATEPHGSARVDRQLFGRAARQGDPGCAQMFCSAEDDLFQRHATKTRRAWKSIGANRLIKQAQARAERLARFNRKQVLRIDNWMDESLPF